MSVWTAKQQEYLNGATHRWNIKCGATRSGKTYLDYYAIPKRIRKVKGLDGLVFLLGNTRGTLDRNVLEPMRKIWGNDLVGSIRNDNTAVIFGEKVYCLGADKITQVDKIRGASVKYCYGDEIVSWNREVFDMLKSRLDKEYSRFDGTCNPGSPQHWVKQFIESNADVFYQQYSIYDNTFLPPVVVAEMEKEHSGVFYDRYILGRWTLAEGLVYPMFNSEFHVVPSVPRPYEKYWISMDYGIQNPTAMILWGLSNGVYYAIREYYHSGRESKVQKTDTEYYTELERLEGANIRADSVIIDPSAASFITLVKQRGRFRVRPAKNDVLDGIREVATALKQGLIKFNDCCENAIREFGLYSWDEKATEDRPIKDSDHCLTGDTIIHTVDGDYPISSLVGKSGKVRCFDDNRQTPTISTYRDVRVTQKEAKIYLITLENGDTIKATDEHLVLTGEGWKEVRQLTSNDGIIKISI